MKIFIFFILLITGNQAFGQVDKFEYPDTLWVYGNSIQDNYGLTPLNPIRVGGGTLPKNVYRYLKSLTDSNGTSVIYNRIGSCCSDEIHRDKPLTAFEIQMNGKVLTLYFDQYVWEKPMIIKDCKWKETRTGYYGELKSDTIFEGKGVYFFGDGGYYKGEWKDGMMNGQGTMFIPETETYTGNFTQGKYNGFEILKYPDGGWYEGNWQMGLKSGLGKIYYPPGREIRYIEGNFSDNQPQGTFKIYYADGATGSHEF
jgi:hypothetical protein